MAKLLAEQVQRLQASERTLTANVQSLRAEEAAIGSAVQALQYVSTIHVACGCVVWAVVAPATAHGRRQQFNCRCFRRIWV